MPEHDDDMPLRAISTKQDPAQPLLTPRDDIIFRMEEITRALRQAFERRIAHTGLTRTQWRIIAYLLRQQGLTQSDLARLLDLERATVGQAIEASGLLQKHPEIDIAKTNKLGVFAKLVKADTVLRDRDRVEIYRPLIADPKDVRRKRAEEGKVMKKGGGPAEDAAG